MSKNDDQEIKNTFPLMLELFSSLKGLVSEVLQNKEQTLTEEFYNNFEADYKRLEKDVEKIQSRKLDMDIKKATPESRLKKMMKLVNQAMEILGDFIFRREPKINKEEIMLNELDRIVVNLNHQIEQSEEILQRIKVNNNSFTELGNEHSGRHTEGFGNKGGPKSFRDYIKSSRSKSTQKGL